MEEVPYSKKSAWNGNLLCERKIPVPIMPSINYKIEFKMNKVLQYITVSLILLVAFACEEDININGDHQAILNVHFMKDSTQAYWMQIEPVANNAIIASLHQSLVITDTVSDP